jgi:hypothetical protein
LDKSQVKDNKFTLLFEKCESGQGTYIQLFMPVEKNVESFTTTSISCRLYSI